MRKWMASGKITLLRLATELSKMRPLSLGSLIYAGRCSRHQNRWSFVVGVDPTSNIGLLSIFSKTAGTAFRKERPLMATPPGGNAVSKTRAVPSVPLSDLDLANRRAWRIAGGLPHFALCQHWRKKSGAHADSVLSIEGLTLPTSLRLDSTSAPWKPHPKGWRLHHIHGRSIRSSRTLLHVLQRKDYAHRFVPVDAVAQHWRRPSAKGKKRGSRWDFQLGVSAMSGYVKRAARSDPQTGADAQVDLPIGLRITPRARLSWGRHRRIYNLKDAMRLLFVGGPFRALQGQLSLDFPLSLTYLAPLDSSSRRRFRIRAGMAVTLENRFAKLTLPALLNLALPEIGMTVQKDKHQDPVWGFYLEFLRCPITYRLTRQTALEFGIGLTLGYRFVKTTSGRCPRRFHRHTSHFSPRSRRRPSV
jgi:hypothetical protein